jgi:prepilin-type processing-associated H-X9-DG protein
MGTSSWIGGPLTKPLGYGEIFDLDHEMAGTDKYALSLIANPADKIMLAETQNGNQVCAAMYIGEQLFLQDSIHNGKLNWAFMDGHAKTLTVGQTMAPTLMWNPTDTYPFYVVPPWFTAFGWPSATANQASDVPGLMIMVAQTIFGYTQPIR